MSRPARHLALTATFRKSDPGAPADFFRVEADGLEWLRSAGAVAVPAVISVDAQHIAVERIEHGTWTDATDEEFGRELAMLHRSGAPSFGGPNERAYIGPLAMPNHPTTTWPELYATERVEPFVGALPADGRALVSSVLARLPDLAGPAEPPARIHGDLWRGNVLVDPTGTPWLIDPAAHGGHRETDLAMMRLFGGFGDRCYAAYDEEFPLADGWHERIALHQLHPLLVHVNLFGDHYVRQALDAARCYA